MPPKGNEARAAALAEMAALLHRMRTEPRLGELTRTAPSSEPLDDAAARQPARDAPQLAPVRTRCRRRWCEAQSLATSRCEHAWRTQRPANDWAGFLAQPARGAARSPARRRAARRAHRPVALRRAHRPLRARHDVRRGRARVRRPEALAAGADPRRSASARRSETVIAPRGPVPDRGAARAVPRGDGAARLRLRRRPARRQRASVLRRRARGRAHHHALPRRRLRAEPDGHVHETGHGALRAEPAARAGSASRSREARSMAIHESQSLSSRCSSAASRLRRRCSRRWSPSTSARSPRSRPHNLHRLLTRVEPGLIRVDADEVTYPAHVILRYEIERALIEGEIEPEDIPALWDEKMASLLGLDTRGNYKRRPHAGRALARRPVRLLPVLHARRDVRGAVVRGDAPRHARPRRAHRRAATSRRSSTGCATTSGARPAAGPPTSWRARQRRDAEPGPLPAHLEARYLAGDAEPCVQCQEDAAASSARRARRREAGLRRSCAGRAWRRSWPARASSRRVLARRLARPATLAPSSSMRVHQRARPSRIGTPSLFIALAVRCSKIDSSLSHAGRPWP